MFELDVRDNIAEVLARVRDRRKAIPVATANALTNAAFKVRDINVTEMKRVFDRPTPFTLHSLFVYRATASKLTARLFLKESKPGKHYLRPEIYGGPRLPKAFEQALRARGYLPADMFAVPGSAAKLDAFGNMSRGEITKILSALGAAERTAGYSANRTQRSIMRRGRKLGEYFVGRPGGGRLPLGVWQVFRFAHGKAIKPVLMFVHQPNYRPRFDFFGVSQRVASKAFSYFFEQELRGLPSGRSLSVSP